MSMKLFAKLLVFLPENTSNFKYVLAILYIFCFNKKALLKVILKKYYTSIVLFCKFVFQKVIIDRARYHKS